MAKPEKVAAVAELTEQFSSSSAAVLTEYRGLTVAQMKELRRSLGEGATYAVVKNTLTKIAAREAGVSGLDDLLAGPSAIAFIKGEPVEAARGLRDFAKTHPLLVIKGGVLDGKPLSAADLAKLADLESRDVLLGKAAGAMNATMAKAAALFQAPLSQAVRLVEALRADRAQGAPADEVAAATDTEVAAPTDTEVAAATDTEVAAPVAATDTEVTATADTEVAAPTDTEVAAPVAASTEA